MAKILLVDDNDTFRDMVDQMLRRAGYEVIGARDGKEALQLYDAQTVNLVVADLIMPDMEGIQLIMELRRRDAGVKIIAMSGGGRNSPEDYLPVARALGAVHTLAKPFSSDELSGAIQSIIGS